MIKKILAGIALATAAASAAAVDLDFSWTFDGMRVDGTQGDINNVDSFKIYVVENGQTTVLVEGIDPAVRTYTFPNAESLGPGEKSYTMSVVDVNGIESAQSAPASVNLSPFNPPTGVEIKIIYRDGP